MKYKTDELIKYNSPFTHISIDIQNTVTPQNLLQISSKYEVTSEILNYINAHDTNLVNILLDSYDILPVSFRNNPRLVLHSDVESSEKLLFIHLDSITNNHKKRFEKKLELLKKLYENNKDYNKYFGITFD